MKLKILTALLGVLATFVLFTNAASAHINDKVPANQHRTEQGAPFPGFVGPIEATELNGAGPGTIDSANYVKAHSGMECGALRSPNITALGPVENGGAGFDDRFICPSAP